MAAITIIFVIIQALFLASKKLIINNMILVALISCEIAIFLTN
jgi:hypothetical protein